MFYTLFKLMNRMLPLIMPVLWSFLNIKYVIGGKINNSSKRKRKILLISPNTIAADHLKIILKLLSGDNALQFFITGDQLINRKVSNADLIRIVNISYLPVAYTVFMFWDLIIYVNHPWGLAIWYSPLVKKIYINHGICTGKINNDKGEEGVYGESRVIRPYTKPLYDIMFASSFFEKEQAIKATPALEGRVKVTGFLRADMLEELEKTNREKIREDLGYGKDEIIVHIISTWGPMSLYQTVGDELLEEAARHTGRYRFQFSLHPRHDEFGDKKGKKREDIVNYYKNKGIVIVDALEWDRYVVAADMAISDHSSLSLYHVLLNKPVILVPVPGDGYIQGSAFDQLRSIATILTNPFELLETIEIARKREDYSSLLSGLKQVIRSYPGLAAVRYKEEIYKLLQKDR